MDELIYVDKNCPHCDAHFNAGRRDKKFCSARCRSQHHNHKNRDPKSKKVRVERSLRRNYRLLKELTQNPRVNRCRVPEVLFGSFYFGHFTSQVLAPASGRVVYLVYDLGWSRNPKDGTYQLYYYNQEGRLTAFSH